jgi:hypothetical protein
VKILVVAAVVRGVARKDQAVCRGIGDTNCVRLALSECRVGLGCEKQRASPKSPSWIEDRGGLFGSRVNTSYRKECRLYSFVFNP